MARPRRISGSPLSLKLNQLIKKYEGVLHVSPDEILRAIAYDEPLSEFQIGRLKDECKWSEADYEEVLRLSGYVVSPKPSAGALGPQGVGAVERGVERLLSRASLRVSSGVVLLGRGIKVPLAPLHAYLQTLQGAAQIINPFAEGGTITLDNVYVEVAAAEDQRATPVPRREETTATSSRAGLPRRNPLEAWRESAQRRRIPLPTLLGKTGATPVVLFGDPGSGKTTVITYALHQCARAFAAGTNEYPSDALPFQIRLRDFAVRGRPFSYDLLSYLLVEKLKVRPAQLRFWRSVFAQLCTGTQPFKLLLLIDGVDEISHDVRVFRKIRDALERAASYARVVITSRRAGFLSPLRTFAAYELVNLEEVSIHGLIRNWFRHVHPRPPDFAISFARWVFGDPGRQEMAANPCLLSLLCYLNQSLSDGEFVQAQNRADLFRRAAEKLSSDYDRLGELDRRESLNWLGDFALSRYLESGDGSAPYLLFCGDDVQRCLSGGTSGHGAPTGLGPTPRVSSLLEGAWLRSRLVSRWNLEDWYFFIHLSFQEFFAARRIAQLSPGVAKDLLAKRRFDPHWGEIWRFYSGICATMGTEGQSRFRDLVLAYAAQRDLYDQCLLYLAPLCSEYQERDTRKLLGFDLRDELYRAFRDGPNQTHVGVRRMVDLDPEYFLRIVKERLEAVRERYRIPNRRGLSKAVPDEGEMRLAVQVLEAIYHPDALAFHSDLIAAEAHWPALRRGDPQLGPVTASGRNIPICPLLTELLETAAGRLHRERLVTYLTCTRDPDAGKAILEAARRERNQVLVMGSPASEGPDLLEFQAHCIWALTQLRDVRAAELAEELWQNQEFRRGHFGEIATLLIDVRDKCVPDFLEKCIADVGGEASTEALEASLEVLAGWSERPLPPAIESLVTDRCRDPRIRAAAWKVLVARSKVDGEQRLRKHLAEMAAKRNLTENDCREIAYLSEWMPEQGLAFQEEFELLLRRHGRTSDPLLLDAVWSALTLAHSGHSHRSGGTAWFRTRCLPALHTRLVSGGRSKAPPPSNWLHALAACDERVIRDLADMATNLWRRIRSEYRISIVRLFSEMPHLAPEAIVLKCLKSDDVHLRDAALDIVTESDPGILVSEREKDASINKVLQRKSITDGPLFFSDRYYCPRRLTFVLYGPLGDS